MHVCMNVCQDDHYMYICAHERTHECMSQDVDYIYRCIYECTHECVSK